MLSLEYCWHCKTISICMPAAGQICSWGRWFIHHVLLMFCSAAVHTGGARENAWRSWLQWSHLYTLATCATVLMVLIRYLLSSDWYGGDYVWLHLAQEGGATPVVSRSQGGVTLIRHCAPALPTSNAFPIKQDYNIIQAIKHWFVQSYWYASKVPLHSFRSNSLSSHSVSW